MLETSPINLSVVFAGVDEAGRGPLAGPVAAAAVILSDDYDWSLLNDSKKLSAKKRSHLADEIRQHASSWAIAYASAKEIDELNIHNATLLAMKRAVEALTVRPEKILVDGKFCPDVAMESEAIIKGDSKVKAIAAASILAKTWRDELMLELHRQMPEFGFDKHKGYPTKAHLAAIEAFGISQHHRLSYKPVKCMQHKFYQESAK